MIYEFECLKGHNFEEFLDYKQRNTNVFCPICKSMGQRLISLPMTHKDKAFSFVDYNTTGKPVEIRSKGQWKKHLKSHGLHDDVSNSPIKFNDLKPEQSAFDKQKAKKEMRST